MAPDVDYLCSKCAKAKGGRWPEGHCATCHIGRCGVCGEQANLSCVDDWVWGNDNTIPPERWD